MSELQDLLNQKEILTEQLRRLTQETSNFNVNKIFNAIKNQRNFTFKNKAISFDFSTALIWFRGQSCLPKNLISEIDFLNERGIDGYKNWRVPTLFELVNLYSEVDKVFVDVANGSLSYSDGKSCKTNSRRKYELLTCSTDLRPKDYEKFTETEKLKTTLNIFVANELEPIFNDAAITELYRQIYIVKPEGQKKLAEIKSQITECEKLNLISSKLDWAELNKKFDIGADSSPIRYAVSIKNLTEHLIGKLAEYVAEKSAVLDELQKLSPPKEISPDFEKVRADLENFYINALNLYKKFIAAENLEMLKIEFNYPSFALVTEILTEKIRQEILKVELFEIMPDFVRDVCAELNRPNKISELQYKSKIVLMILELFNYTLEGHLRKKSGDLTIAQKVLEKICVYSENLRKSENLSDADLKLRKTGFKKNMQEIIDILYDEEERRWIRSKIHIF
ncbi:MAG: hypothetical protein IJS81_03190 [Selenomonadaceae bacterium]|nr:hypothetical protein [Selenomonadaceae bacterium]